MPRDAVRDVAEILERQRIDFRVALPRHPHGRQDDEHRHDEQQHDRDGTLDGDLSRHQTFTNLRNPTFRIKPMAMKNIIVAEPPYEISGKGIPVTGSKPIGIKTLIRMLKMKKQISDRTRNVPPRSRDAFATDRDSTIRNRYNVSTTLTPTKPHSSPRTEKMKSVCRAGRYSRLTCVPCRNPLPVMPPEPVAILACVTW